MIAESQDYITYNTSSSIQEIQLFGQKLTSFKKQQKEENSKSFKQIQIVGITAQPLIQDTYINFPSELILTNDGALRFFHSQNWLSFGFQQNHIADVKQLKSLGVVQISFEKKGLQQYFQMDQALQIIKKIPTIQYASAEKLIQKYYNLAYFFKNVIQNTDEYIQNLREYEFLQFKNVCYNFMKQYTQQQSVSKMYSYSLGRLSLQSKEIETIEVGYSQEYLDFLGLSYDNLSHIALRKQRIDLIQNVQDITNQSLKAIQKITSCGNKQDDYSESEIVTFDGFPIKIYQKKNIFSELFKHQQTYGIDQQFFLAITEIDLDLKDLENLIMYRQRIYENNEKLSIDDFLRKELSYKFEDVEYSVHSQAFVDKFYNENVQSLKKLLQMDELNHLRCKFKYIDKNTYNKKNI
ncbi:hypothetical protein TTHERM_00327190 (macronuclear) [Tetrahymena thermophila SB210]|uniref:Uncharacterized protein n=1 Tax=Tetrahymena thermophila (strain SB210) TaxID=312017 RepID=I7MMR1_TETTS|nr:hypothetical protein TTHERM_00327190 [Tetrahymena thermophila SB210]EAS06237.2 hypothetical protein TTHERM_00327190 [Tetrahymena thermophila SB210]|eukprot:XP_001026482.2 hypothetical protein TTHERM_00327190 [Tetrahymena thermophila SB210]